MQQRHEDMSQREGKRCPKHIQSHSNPNRTERQQSKHGDKCEASDPPRQHDESGVEADDLSARIVLHNVRVTRDHGEVRTKRSEYADALGRRR
jgi:hypothetical protein